MQRIHSWFLLRALAVEGGRSEGQTLPAPHRGTIGEHGASDFKRQGRNRAAGVRTVTVLGREVIAERVPSICVQMARVARQNRTGATESDSIRRKAPKSGGSTGAALHDPPF